MKISIVIPAYNEAENIKETINEINLAIKDAGKDVAYEYIVVDDHSSDNLLSEIKQMKDIKIRYLRLSRQSGSHIALRAGFKAASGDAVLFMTADGEDDPTALPSMIKKWRSGSHVVWALRETRKGEALYISKPAQWFYKIMYWLVDVDTGGIDMNRADFFLVDRTVCDAINSCPERNTSFFGLLSWVGFNQDFVEYKRRLRRKGVSKWTFRKRLRLAKDWIIAFSGMPLKIMISLGFFFAVIGFIYGVMLVFNALFGHPLYGWSSLMVAILVMGGIQMMMLGIMGEYVWRNLEESRKRPLYFIEREE